MKVDLNKYVKEVSKDGGDSELTTTSIKLKRNNMRFLKSKKLNLSAIVRDYLDRLESEEKSA